MKRKQMCCVGRRAIGHASQIIAPADAIARSADWSFEKVAHKLKKACLAFGLALKHLSTITKRKLPWRNRVLHLIFHGNSLAQPLSFDNVDNPVRKYFAFTRQSVTGWRSFIPLSVVGALAFFVGLWLLGFPKPANDDLFYSGAALNLASGGDFSNPLLARQGFPSHYFFVYPPLHSFVLAGWLRLFGINSTTVMGFAVMTLWLTCAATVLILRRHQAPVWLEWLVPLGVSFAFLPLGLRPETLATALALTGFAITEWCGISGVRMFTGFLLMFLGASCAPRVTIFATALVLCAGYKLLRDDTFGRPRLWRVCVLWLGALLVAIFIFLLLIDFRLGEFLQTFHFHAARVAGKPLAILKDYALHFLGILQWPLVLIPLGLLIYDLRKPKAGLNLVGMFIAGAFPLAALTGGIGLGTIWWAILLMLILAGSVAKGGSRLFTSSLRAGVIFALLLANRKLAANCLGLVTGNISTELGEQRESALALRPTPDHPLLLDSAMARYIFDYRIPEGAVDLEFGTKFPGTFPGDLDSAELRKGDVFLAGAETVSLLANITYLEQATPKWSAFGLGALTFEKYPRRIYIIPAESCKGSRPSGNKTKIWMPQSSGIKQ